MKRLVRFAVRWFFWAAVLFGCYIVFVFACYSAADLAYKKLEKHDPKTRQEVEAVLPWCRVRCISGEESPFWAEQLVDSAMIVRYTVFGIPGDDIDVVYDKNGTVVTWFGTYE